MTSGAWACAALANQIRSASARMSVPGDGHALDENRAAGAAAAHHDVVADGADAAEHVAQVAGDGDLLHREADLAALDPVAGGAARVVAGDEVDALAEQLGDEQP